MSNYIDAKSSYPEFFTFNATGSGAEMLYSSGNFLRNDLNSNIEVLIPLGPDVLPSTVWLSPDVYLDNGTLNVNNPISEISFYNDVDVKISSDLTFYHDLLIQYKLTKHDGTNYINQRELRCVLTKADGVTMYSDSMYANQQPDSGQHDYILLRGAIQHHINDLVRIKLNIAQDNTNTDQTDSSLTILRITWNINALTAIV